MIFTHIFRYLDDRDAAAEELRRASSTNTTSPAINSRFQEPSSWEHRDVRFKQISLKAAPNFAGSKVLQTPRKDCLTQGFCTLRAQELRPSPKPRVLPPIRGSHVTGVEKQLTVNEQSSAKLPPIEPLASRAHPGACKKRPRSKRNKDTVLTCRNGVENSHVNPYRVKDDEEMNADRNLMATITGEDNLADQSLVEEPPENKQETKTDETASFNDMSTAKAGLKKNFHNVCQQSAKQEDFETRTEAEDTKADAITTDNSFTERGCTVGGQSSVKEWSKTKEYTVNTNTEDVDFYKRLGLSELHGTENSIYSAKQNKENGNISYSTRNTTNAEYLHFKSDEVALVDLNGSLDTNAEKETNLRLNAWDLGRRNAICEVIEKSTPPEFGSSLYEMRQNLIRLL